MGQIISNGTFSPANLQAPGLYINNLPPPSYIPGVPTNVAGVIGTASWGPVNSPILLGSPQDATTNFGGITAASVTDVYDLCTDINIAYQQGPMSIWAQRATNGADAAATVKLYDTTTPTALSGATVTALYTGTAGNSITLTITKAVASGNFNVVVNGFAGTNPETYTNLPGGTAFWDALVNAFSNGIQNVRGPSVLVRASSGASAATTPATGTFTLTGGNDGRTGISTAQLLGSDATYPGTGIYAFANLQPVVGTMWIAGLTDQTALPNIQSFVDANAIYTALAFPTGTSTATAVAAVTSVGVHDYEVSYLKDWIYWFDSVNGQVRLVPPYAFILGTVTAQAPQNSPTNKPVSGVLGTERNSPYTGNTPYSLAELGELEAAGILVITNPIPSGNTFGIYTGTNTALNLTETPVEYARMTNFLDQSFNATMGIFVGQLQTARQGDPLRAQVRHMLNQFLTGLQNGGQIDAYQVQCSFAQSGNPSAGVNTPSTIAQHYLYAACYVRYLSSVRYFVISLQGGTTVVTSQAG